MGYAYFQCGIYKQYISFANNEKLGYIISKFIFLSEYSAIYNLVNKNYKNIYNIIMIIHIFIFVGSLEDNYCLLKCPT